MTFITARHINIKAQKGFTLIELLIVIAVLGVLAAALLVTLDPLEQLARGRDAGRESTIDQLGHSVSAYYVANGNVYPAGTTGWQTALVSAGELKLVSGSPSYGSGTAATCPANSGTAGGEGAPVAYCYNSNATDAIVYASAESKSFKSKAGCAAAQVAWVVWSSADGKTGLTCTGAIGTAPIVGITGLK